MPLAPANQSHLIRSSQKDEYYQSSLRNTANEAFQTLAGSKRWLDWRREIELLSDLAYYGLTTFSEGAGEPGERAGRQGGEAAAGSVPVLEPGGLAEEGGAEGGGLLPEPQRRACLPAVSVLRQALTLLQRLHVALFYLSGSFYHLSKRRLPSDMYLRVTGLQGDDSTIRSSYRLLGALSLLQLLITVSLQLNNYRKKQRARQEWQLHRNLSPQHTHSGGGPQGASCMLCLEERRHSTSTPCGHLFCWECITE
ncbi:hypothetical protein F7725_000196, partial [Dissostichus mawsoni]